MLALKERYFSGAVPRFSTPNSTDLIHTVTLDYQGVCAIHHEYFGGSSPRIRLRNHMVPVEGLEPTAS